MGSVLHAFRSWKSAQIRLAIAALAIGIASTTAIYTVVHAVLLEPLPWADGSRYFYVFSAHRSRPDSGSALSYANANAVAEHLQSAEMFGCYAATAFVPGNFNAILNGQPVHVKGTSVSPELIGGLGLSPVLGRWFRTFKDEPGGYNVAVLSFQLWQRFGADPQILGKALSMNDVRYSIVGVAPASLRLPVEEPNNDVWVPLQPPSKDDKGSTYLFCIAKLRAGVSEPQMEQELTSIQAQFAQQSSDRSVGETVFVMPGLKLIVDSIRPTLLLLLGAAGALLLISCANVASLLLARSVARARETSVRVALGATSWQLGLQYLSEGLMVAIPGAALGTLASFWAVRSVLSLGAGEIPRADQIRLNGPVLVFTLAVSVMCALLFSLVPLWHARKAQPNEVLSDGARASAGQRSRAPLRVFVVVELMLAFALVVVGGMLIEQLGKLERVQPGFDPDHLLAFTILVPAERFPDDALRTAHEQRLSEAIRAVPGVEAASFAFGLPLAKFQGNSMMWLDGQPQPDVAKAPRATLNVVHPDYFRAMRIPLLAGRFFNDSDGPSKEEVPVIINQTAARQYWPGRDPIGSYLRLINALEWRFRVVGLVGDFHEVALGQPPRPAAFLNFRQGLPFQELQFVVRSQLAEGPLISSLRRAVQSVDSEQSIYGVRPMREIVANSITRERLGSFMVSFFAVSALVLAILGVYGVVAYSVRQRTVEMGTRMALGANSRDLRWLVVGDGLKMAAIGVGIGLLAVFALSRYLATTALPLKLSGPLPFLAAAVLTAGLSGLACFVPAWRTTLLSPLVAIRNESESLLVQVRRKFAAATSHDDEPVDELEVLANLVEASRGASSFEEAIQISLSALREAVGAEFVAFLVQSSPNGPYRCIGAEPEAIGTHWSLPPNPLLLGRLRHASWALPMTTQDLETWSKWARSNAPAHLDEIQTLQGIRAAAAAPAEAKSGMIGILLLGARSNDRRYSIGARRAIRGASSQLALLVENARLSSRIVEQERLKRELQLATEVQKRLFPEKAPETAVIRCAGLCLPARGVGGDYYDFLDLGERRTGIALADVAGKGIAAALVMSVVQASLRSLAETNGASLCDLASRMNRLLYRSTPSSSYATFFYAEFLEETRRLRYVNAGHNPPYVFRAGTGQIEELPAGGMFIGMFPQARFEEAVTDLAPGDVLLAFSDGVPEAHNPSDEEFGEDRVKDLMRRTAHLPVNEMSSQILAELRNWMTDAEQYDDLTFVVMKVQP